MARIIILSARSWSLRDEKTGELREGVKVEGSETEIASDPDYRGAGAVEYPATPEAWNVLKNATIPGIFDVEIGIARAKMMNGKAAARASILSVSPVAGIDLNPAARKAVAA